MLPINSIILKALEYNRVYVMLSPKKETKDFKYLSYYNSKNGDYTLELSEQLQNLDLEKLHSIVIFSWDDIEKNEIIFSWFNPQQEQKNVKQADGEFYTKLLDWQIKQQEQNEDRLDRRLKELLKTATAERNIPQQSGMDLSSILPMLQPILQKLQEGK